MSRIASHLSVLLSLPLLALVAGCGTTATLSLADGRSVEGKIIRSNTSTVSVESQFSTIEVSRSEITDIDHPGNVAATIGGVLTAYGVANMAIGMSDCARTEDPAYCTGVILPAAVGISLLTYGGIVWTESRRSAEGDGSTSSVARMTVVPMASFDKKDQVYGASALVSF